MRMRMNVALLKRVAKELEAHPEVFDQSQFGKVMEDDDYGTTCCIAGMAVLLTKPLLYLSTITERQLGAQGTIPQEAQKLLGISRGQAQVLFCSACNWPEPFASDYQKVTTSAARARVGARRIAYFIRTGGR